MKKTLFSKKEKKTRHSFESALSAHLYSQAWNSLFKTVYTSSFFECFQTLQELGQWTGRVREAGDQAQRADAKLVQALREAKSLREELRLTHDDVALLRTEADQTANERSRLQEQVEVSRNHHHEFVPR